MKTYHNVYSILILFFRNILKVFILMNLSVFALKSIVNSSSAFMIVYSSMFHALSSFCSLGRTLKAFYKVNKLYSLVLTISHTLILVWWLLLLWKCLVDFLKLNTKNLTGKKVWCLDSKKRLLFNTKMLIMIKNLKKN